MDNTQKYYRDNFESFINNTINCDMSGMYHFFESFLKEKNATILDLGFGSGRDILYFKDKEYDVYGVDPLEEFCNNLTEKGIKNIYCNSANDMDFNDKFDGIWACASLLHVDEIRLQGAFKNCSKALKKNGVMYCSFKYGSFKGIRNGRYNVDLDENSICKYLNQTGLKIEKIIITNDVRKERNNEKWLNLILIKVDES